MVACEWQGSCLTTWVYVNFRYTKHFLAAVVFKCLYSSYPQVDECHIAASRLLLQLLVGEQSEERVEEDQDASDSRRHYVRSDGVIYQMGEGFATGLYSHFRRCLRHRDV